MRAEFQYTFEDFREAEAALHGSNRGSNPARVTFGRGLLGWLLFIGLSVMLVVLVQRSRSNPPTRGGPAGPTAVAPSGNQPVDLLLSFVPWVVIFGFIWVFVYRQIRQQARTARDWEKTPAYHRP